MIEFIAAHWPVILLLAAGLAVGIAAYYFRRSIGLLIVIVWRRRRSLLLNFTGLAGLGMIGAGLWLFDPALSLTVIGVIFFAVAVYCMHLPPPDWQ